MYCPTCGTEQAPGDACIACGRPFRRSVHHATRPHRVRRFQRRAVAPRAFGCATTLVAALVVVLAIVAMAMREPLQAPEGTRGTATDVVPGATSAPLPASERAGTTTNGGTFVVTEEDVNRWLAENEQALRPASDARAEIDSDGIAVHVRVLGVDTVYRARPTVRDGRIVLHDARVEGPLGLGFPADVVTRRLQAELDKRLAASGVRATALELAPGVVTVTVEPVAE